MKRKKTTPAQLRAALSRQVERSELDVDSILRLAIELGRASDDTVRFSTDAGIVKRLGQELVGKQETALAELVKNAYDADATKVDLTLVDAYSEKGTLTVLDNGHGMSLEDLKNCFMRISTDDKIRHPTSPKYRRRRAGEKGIGRFAAERLGSRLVLTSKRRTSRLGFRVKINWDDFQSGTDISLVPSSIEHVEVDFRNGTELRIEDLRDSWSDASLRQVWRYVASLQTPFPQTRSTRKEVHDPGFKAWFYRGDSGSAETTKFAEPNEFFEHAIARIDFEIDNKGVAKWSLKSKRYGNSRKRRIGLNRDNPEPLSHARGVVAKVYYYIRSSEFYPWGVFGPLSELLREQGGIRIYRRGYRVLPYGEAGNDWLGLDATYRQRSTVLAPIANTNWLGYVTISEAASTLFTETSSREGLIENEAYTELRKILSSTLLTAALFVDNQRQAELDRRKKQLAKQRKSTIANATTNVVKKLRRLTKENDPDKREAISSEAEDAIDDLASKYEERLKELAEEDVMLKILASMGLTIAEFTHEYGSRAGAMKNDVDTLFDDASSERKKGRAVARLRSSLSDVEGFSQYFATTLQQNLNREIRPIELYVFASEFATQMKPLFGDRIQQIFVPEPHEEQIFTTSMHPSEWSSILMNLMTNSRKAIDRRRIDSGKILIETGFADSTHVYLLFADNGDGIDSEIEDKIFEPFFTTTSAPPSWTAEQDTLLGTGLGLKIVRDILERVDGSIDLVEAPHGYSTAFQAIVPAATSTEIEGIYDD